MFNSFNQKEVAIDILDLIYRIRIFKNVFVNFWT